MKITVKGMDFDVNLLDFDTAKAYEDSIKKIDDLSRKWQKPDANRRLTDIISKGCKVVDEAIDSLLGVGTAEKLFNDKKDLLEHSKIWIEIIGEIKKGSKEETQVINLLSAKADSNA